MSLIVQKYGGSSVANPERIKRVAERAQSYRKRGHSLVVVVSALGDTTDQLLELAGQITKEPSRRELDMLMSTGEQISVALLAMALHELGCDAISLPTATLCDVGSDDKVGGRPTFVVFFSPFAAPVATVGASRVCARSA